MNEPYLEYADVFLPGQGETLMDSPAWHWIRTEEDVESSAKEGLSGSSESIMHSGSIVGHFYTSTSDPNRLLIHVTGTNYAQRAHNAQAQITIDHTAHRYLDYDGFGVHLPGMIVTSTGTVIAVCQRRHNSLADAGHDTDIIGSFSSDNGKTWSRQQVVYGESGNNTFLGPIVEDRITRTVFVALWNMPAEVISDLGYFGTYAEQGGGFWLVHTNDAGATWSSPRHVDPHPNSDGWIGWPNNSVHGIQLHAGPKNGRIVIPAFLYKADEAGQVPGVRGGLLYSDDHGETWTVGGVLPDGSDEVALIETPSGEIYASYRRNTRKTAGRTWARSQDGGETFYEFGEHAELSGRAVHVGLAELTSTCQETEDLFLFSHPTGSGRVIPGGAKMTIYASYDHGRTWPTAKLLDPRPCRYSDLAVAHDGTVLCLYTVGETRDREKIIVGRFNREWLFT